MLEPKRYYRKKLTSQGLVYIGGEEIEMLVKNLSVSGLFAELSQDSHIQTIPALFDALTVSTHVDFYLPEMRMMGNAQVVRADLIDNRIHLALNFMNISHDAENTLYVRKAYRKDLIAPGQIVFNNQKYTFQTRNVSVAGLMVHFAEKLDVTPDTITIFDFKRLNLRGEIRVVWVKSAEDGGTLMGLEYMHMEKTEIMGIPYFAPTTKRYSFTSQTLRD